MRFTGRCPTKEYHIMILARGRTFKHTDYYATIMISFSQIYYQTCTWHKKEVTKVFFVMVYVLDFLCLPSSFSPNVALTFCAYLSKFMLLSIKETDFKIQTFHKVWIIKKKIKSSPAKRNQNLSVCENISLQVDLVKSE